ncbi:DNA repair protein RecN [Haploplasma axanthum]|uniref:DNA repair protein RecN n=1 Tax=Haploplasma axanthum TaxID=29552 RepID=A0A449BDV4_HAPAX|nr:DNA repair protein RecN [Haploplasma axanthum]VEU80612.1 ABC transporter ATP-binding protein [Haploplasma axanthum]
MIQILKVRDFALIEDIEINFEEGLTVLTGETGAGKSIILESLHLLFAKRSDQEMIRHGKEKAIVSGFFKLKKDLQEQFELPEIIEITREIDSKGRHKITLNGNTVTLQFLKTLTEKIGSIHSQNDTLVLLDPNEYLSFIDLTNIDLINKGLHKYLVLRSNYLDAKKHLENLKQKKNADIEQKEFLEYQLKELKTFKLEKNEKEELELKVEKLKHFDKILVSLKEADYLLHEEIKVDEIYKAAKLIEKISDFDNDYLTSSEKLLNVYYEIDEVKSTINDKLGELDFNENEFNFMQERLYELQKLEDKYKKTIEELIIYQDEISEKISLIDNYDDYIEKYQIKVDKLFSDAYDEAKKLSDLRKKLALNLEKELIKELKDLDLDKSEFKVEFKTHEKEDKILLENGIDNIEFLISLNEGEPIKPLSRVASGGERARFMFALKTIYAKQNNLSLLVLDEIDIGISGKTAAKVATKMSSLSNDIELIVITHLPQVAARANTHYGISKELVNKRMVTSIKKLNYEERVEMIALMLSDESLSHFAVEQAKMLLKK